MMGPFLKSNETNNKMIIRIILALLPLVLFNLYKNGLLYKYNKIEFIEIFKPIFNIFIALLSAFVIEFILNKIFKNKKSNNYFYLIGFIIGIIFPISTPIYVIIIASTITEILKYLLLRFKINIFNPIIIGYLITSILFSSLCLNKTYLNQNNINFNINNDIETIEKANNYSEVSDILINEMPFDISIISIMLIIISYVYLSFSKTIKWRIPLMYVSTVFIMMFAIGQLLGQGITFPIIQILSSGLLFCAVFISTDPLTSSSTPTGQIIEGIILGILTVIFRVLKIDGILFSILIVNMLVKKLDYKCAQIRFNPMKILNILLPLWIIMIIVIMFAAINGKKNIKNKEFKNLELNQINYKI